MSRDDIPPSADELANAAYDAEDHSCASYSDVREIINDSCLVPLTAEIEAISQQCINGDEFDPLVEEVKQLKIENEGLKTEIDRLKRKQEADAKAIQQLFGFFHATGSLEELHERLLALEKYE